MGLRRTTPPYRLNGAQPGRGGVDLVRDGVLAAVAAVLGPAFAEPLVDVVCERVRGEVGGGQDGHVVGMVVVSEMLLALSQHGVSPADQTDCARRLLRLREDLGGGGWAHEQHQSIAEAADIVTARTMARVMARGLGFSSTQQTKIATAVSEVATNIFFYARPGLVRFSSLGRPRQGMCVVAEDRGPGIADLGPILDGTYTSKTGLGLGLRGCMQLMDEVVFERPDDGGTRVRMIKYLGAGAEAS